MFNPFSKDLEPNEDLSSLDSMINEENENENQGQIEDYPHMSIREDIQAHDAIGGFHLKM
jgi:hypothetical protein